MVLLFPSRKIPGYFFHYADTASFKIPSNPSFILPFNTERHERPTFVSILNRLHTGWDSITGRGKRFPFPQERPRGSGDDSASYPLGVEMLRREQIIRLHLQLMLRISGAILHPLRA
jgi:hypothetical protein